MNYSEVQRKIKLKKVNNDVFITPEKLAKDHIEYIKNYGHVDYNALESTKREDRIFYNEMKTIFLPFLWDMLNKSVHTSICFLKELNLEYNDETPEKEIEINLPKDRVDEYAHFNDYYVIAPCHSRPYYGRWFDLNVYANLVKRSDKNIKFVTLLQHNWPLPYESEKFWPDNLDQLQFFLKSVRGVVTIDSSIQHYCNALRKKALVLWGYGKSRVTKCGYKSHINIFNETYDFYDDIPNWNCINPKDIVSFNRTEKNINYTKFLESFEKLVEDTR